MDSWRTHESEKQARVRVQNDSTAKVRAASPAESGGAPFRCECGDGRCDFAITLTLAEYGVVRGHATQFAVARNHENPESEQVMEENARFAVVETVTADATKLARRSDPRQERREKRWRAAPPSAKSRSGR